MIYIGSLTYVRVMFCNSLDTNGLHSSMYCLKVQVQLKQLKIPALFVQGYCMQQNGVSLENCFQNSGVNMDPTVTGA